MKKVRVLILGTGGMATTHAEAYAGIDDAEVVAGVDVNADALRTFCDRFDIETRFDSLEDALDWGEFDAVSNVTPDALHHRQPCHCCTLANMFFVKNRWRQITRTPAKWPKPQLRSASSTWSI